MCSDPEDLRRRASWDGASGTSRRTLLTELQRKLLCPSFQGDVNKHYNRFYTLYDDDSFPPTRRSIDTVEILSKRTLLISQRSDECCVFLIVL